MYAYVAYRLGEGPLAEDVTSDVFERALRYRGSYDAKKGEPIAWLLGIARSCIAGRNGDGALELALEADERPAPGSLEDDAVLRLTLSEAVACLDARDRELIALRYGSDLTARQIAGLLGERTNTVEVALHRALARLRELLSAAEEPAVGSSGRFTAVSPSRKALWR